MNQATTLLIAGIAAALFLAIGSVTPALESAFAQQVATDTNDTPKKDDKKDKKKKVGTNVGNCGGNSGTISGSDACRNSQNQAGSGNTQNNQGTTFN